MDFKVVVAIVAVLFSGFLFYQNQKRADMLIELTRKYQVSVQQANSAGVAAVMSDEALMEVIRQTIKAELASDPSECGGSKFSGSDASKFQDVIQRLAAFEKKFNKAATSVTRDAEKGEVQEKLNAKAGQLKEKIVALCKK